MPYDLHAYEKAASGQKYLIRFRGSAMIPRLNQLAPCRVNLTFSQIETVLESLYRKPIRLEVSYVDQSNREWPISYTNFKKILPKEIKELDQKEEYKPPVEELPPEPVPVELPPEPTPISMKEVIPAPIEEPIPEVSSSMVEGAESSTPSNDTQPETPKHPYQNNPNPNKYNNKKHNNHH